MRRSHEKILIPGLFLLGSFSAIAYAISVRFPLSGGGETVAIAQNLAKTGIYGNPFALTFPTGETAAIVPGYPIFLALNMALFGEEFSKTVGIATFILHGLCPVLILLCATRAFGTLRPGIWAALLATILPVFRFLPASDSMMTADGLMFFYLILTGNRGRQFGTWKLIGLGLLGGVLLLLNASALLVILPFLVVMCARQVSWPVIRSALAIIAVAGLCVLPWVIRNKRIFGSAVMKNNFGFTVYAANNDCAQPALDQMFDCHQEHHPAGSPDEAQLLLDKGEVGYDRYRLASAIEWVRSHPEHFASLTALRVVAFWMPLPSGGPYHWSIWIVTILSIFGFRWLIQLRYPIAFEMAGIFLLYPVMYYVVVADTRYRYPIMWLTLLAAGFACDHLWDSINSRLNSRLRRVVH